jgi:Na+/H+-dicarboxylate symporter
VSILQLTTNTQIFLGAGLGIALGGLLSGLGVETESVKQILFGLGLLGTLFIDLLKMVLAPLVFFSIVVGVANLRQHTQLHQVWVLTLGFFLLTMAIAILLALVAANWFEPGKGLNLDIFAQTHVDVAAKQMSFADFIGQFLHGLFINPFTALAQGNVLAIVIFALMLGIALVMGGERYQLILTFMQEGLELMLCMVGWVMRLAPLGIMALLAQLLATQNISILASLGHFVGVVLGVTLLHGFVILPLLLWMVGKVSPWRFFQGAREALITAFATSSSSATLPVTMRCAEEHLGVKPSIAGFVVPLGATANMDGTALYEAMAALFIANLTGIELDLTQQLIVFFTSMLAAIGAPGIPSAGMVTMVMVLQSVGLPAEAIAILLPIDRVLDTFRTMVNVEGDMIISLMVQRLVKDQ